MAYSEATCDPIFLFQRARYIHHHDSFAGRDLRVDVHGDYGVYDTTTEHNAAILAQAKTKNPDFDEDDEEQAPSDLIYLTDEELVSYECATRYWETEYVFVSREESDAWGERRKYAHGKKDIGWRTYCVCATGTLAEVLNAWSDSSGHQNRPRPAMPASPDPEPVGTPAVL